MRTEDISIKHQFAIQELADMGRDQADKLDRLGTLKAELDSVKKQYASQISEAEAGISRISTKVHAGWEVRNVKCFVIDERPEGYRLLVRSDDGHISKRRKLEASERQLTLSTDPPKQYVSVALLHVDDEGWDVDAYEIPLYEEEFGAIRSLDVLALRDYKPVPALEEAK